MHDLCVAGLFVLALFSPAAVAYFGQQHEEV